MQNYKGAQGMHIMSEETEIENLKKQALEELLKVFPNIDKNDYKFIGSTYIFNRLGNDIDIVAFSKNHNYIDFVKNDFEFGGSFRYASPEKVDIDDSWHSWKKPLGNTFVNIILTTDKEYFKKWITACEVCKYIVMSGGHIEKHVVHGIHAIIMDNSSVENELSIRKPKMSIMNKN